MKLFTDEQLEKIRTGLEIYEQSLPNCIANCKKYGWSISYFMTPREITEISRLKCEKEIDEYFENFLFGNNNEFYNRMNRINLTKEERFKNSYQQCLFAFENEKYIICINTLFSILEGVLRIYVNDAQNISVAKISKNILDEISESSIHHTIWEINKEIITKWFKYERDSLAEPEFLNRNWLLHGRSEYDVSKYDCLKLMHLISIIKRK